MMFGRRSHMSSGEAAVERRSSVPSGVAGTLHARLGFMQGRLSPPVDGRIQAFPWDHWRAEFDVAARAGFSLMEWTLDLDGLHENPIMRAGGQAEILRLCARTGVSVRSLTGDFFMQAPFFKRTGPARRKLLGDLQVVLESSVAMGVRLVVLPLVDGGSVETQGQADGLVQDLTVLMQPLRSADLRILFESDFPPDRLTRFIDRFPPDQFGINLDIGNSAALGFEPRAEITALGSRIFNVHIKDRTPGGGTVPLGEGQADFPVTFAALKSVGYNGALTLQTARAIDGDDVGALLRYRASAATWIEAAQ